MKNNVIYMLKGLAAVFAVAGLMFISSCQDDDENKQVVLLSFGPSGVELGDEITFFGQNLDNVSAIVFKPAVEVPKSSFTSVTKDRINVIVPDNAEAGTVILKTPNGDIESKTILNFLVPISITSITPEAKPGTNITITGDKLNWIETITFAADQVVEKENFVSVSLNELVVTVPMAAQTGYLIFSTGGTDPLTFGTTEQFVVTLPTVTALTPSSVKHTDNLTITGTDLDLVTKVLLGGGQEVTEFVSQSETALVLTVPVGTVKGKLTLKQESPVDVVTTDELTIILPTSSSVSPSPAKPGIDNLTITGADLDLVKSIILPGVPAISTFVSQSATQIVLAIPAAAKQGPIEYITIHDYQHVLEGAILKLPPSGAYPVLDKYIYKNGLENGWQAWGGWGHVSQDYSNTENPADGASAIKSVFNDAYGAIQIHNGSGGNPFTGYNYLVFYVYVAGEDSDIIAQLSGSGDYYPPHFTKNKYTQIVVPLASLPGSSGASIGELIIKNNNPVTDQNTTVFVDEIGLTVDAPLGILPDLSTTIYEDALNSPFGLGGGWGGSTTNASSSEQQRSGSSSVKAVFAGGWSGACQFGAWGNPELSTAGMTYFSFSIYGGAGAGATVQINIKPTTAGTAVSKQVNVTAGKWTDVKIPLSDFGSPATIGEIQFQDTGWAGTLYVDHVGLQ